jgi:hypothetical protein
MKKALLLAFTAVLAGTFVFAQEGENEMKNVRFGLMVNPQMTWYKPDSKKLTSGGAVAKIGGGLAIEFRLAKVASLTTGFMINLNGGKLNMVDTTYYFLSSEGEFQARSEALTTATSVQYKLNNRIYKNSYITVPLIFKLKTPEIGALTYFGQFGLNSNIRWKSKVTDDVNSYMHTAHNRILITQRTCRCSISPSISEPALSGIWQEPLQ